MIQDSLSGLEKSYCSSSFYSPKSFVPSVSRIHQLVMVQKLCP